jgi:hypothetical protein
MSISLKKSRSAICVLLIIFLPILSSCAEIGGSNFRTWIDFPPPGSEFLPGDTVPITAHFYAADKIDRVIISVNGKSIKEISSPDHVRPVGEVKKDWIPEEPGQYTIGVSLITKEGEPASSAKAVIFVSYPAEEAPVPLLEGFFASNGFCRSGPGTVYDIEGVYDAGYQVMLEARSEPGIPLWWYIYDQAGELYCWVSSVIIITDVDPDLLTALVSPPVPKDSPPPDPGSGELVCHAGLNQEKCAKAGGAWYVPLNTFGDPYCKCPAD